MNSSEIIDGLFRVGLNSASLCGLWFFVYGKVTCLLIDWVFAKYSEGYLEGSA